jgi:hypothetical protein
MIAMTIIALCCLVLDSMIKYAWIGIHEKTIDKLLDDAIHRSDAHMEALGMIQELSDRVKKLEGENA